MKDDKRKLTNILVKYDAPNKQDDFITLYEINGEYTLRSLSVSKELNKHEYDEIFNMIQDGDDDKSTIFISGQPDWLFNKLFVIRDSDKIEQRRISAMSKS